MALLLYKTGLPSTIAYSDDNSFSNPVSWQSTTGGGLTEQRLIVKSNTVNNYYTNIVIGAVDSSLPDKTSWFKFALDVGGVPGTFASTQNIPNVPLNGAQPIWVKLTVPPGQPEESLTTLKISLSYTEHVV